MDLLASTTNHLWVVYQTLPLITQWAITLLVVCGVIVHLFRYNEQTVHDGPSLFTTAGIFFTFLGIAQGLYDFDAQKIDASLPALLAGLKTAFVASVFGVGIALSIKLRFTLFGLHNTDPNLGEDATVGDVVLQISSLQKSLVGDDDSTLLSQLKLTRQDTNDKLDQLNRSQREFLENSVKNNSEALIQALQQVIRDFNTKISEQFGDNFKQLNAAVGGLLEWQEHYRLQMETMIEQESIASTNMRSASESFSGLVNGTSHFKQTSEALSGLLTGLHPVPKTPSLV